MEPWSSESRARIARGWAESGLSQAEYSKKFGIAPRTLRAWVERYASRQPPDAQVRAVVVETIAKLGALLDALDRAAACRDSAASARPVAGGEPEAPDDYEVSAESEAQAALHPDFERELRPAHDGSTSGHALVLHPERRALAASAAPGKSFFSDFQ